MSKTQGTIVLMGSGELTATMVEVHKALLAKLGGQAKAVFLDTPAGFQLNVDHISRRAVDYFNTRVGHPLSIASYKSAHAEVDHQQSRCMTVLHQADYVLIGPGSPTYALKQWRSGWIPNALTDLVASGGCLVAASAAALTVGSHTLPVYEIYKVGEDLHWVEGLDILGHFGLKSVVVPHWNNAEGGNHDTRFCFMGDQRFKKLEALLPESTAILGLDEHTAMIIDFDGQKAQIKGVGRVVLRRNGQDRIFFKDDVVPLTLLRGESQDAVGMISSSHAETTQPDHQASEAALWNRLHERADLARENLLLHQPEKATSNLLTLERLIWHHQQSLQQSDGMGAAREILRELIALFGSRLAAMPQDRKTCLEPLVNAVLTLRDRLRSRQQWDLADQLRDCLKAAGVMVEDSDDRTRWYLHEN